MRRLILSAVVFLLSFIAIQAAVSYLFPGPRTMMGGLQEQDIYNTVIAIALAAIVAVGAYSLQNKEAAPAGKRSIDIVKTALSDDEKALLDEVEKAGQITQDSLRSIGPPHSMIAATARA